MKAKALAQILRPLRASGHDFETSFGVVRCKKCSMQFWALGWNKIIVRCDLSGLWLRSARHNGKCRLGYLRRSPVESCVLTQVQTVHGC